MKPADILAIQGMGWLSASIMEATHSRVSHVALGIASNPDLVIEALSRVRTRPLELSITDAAAAWLIEPLELSDAQRAAIVRAACLYSAQSYNSPDVILQGMDAATRTRWWTDHFATERWPICSMLVGRAYHAMGLDFGVSDRSLTPGDILGFAQGHPDKYRIAQLK
ncbi:MAG: hypothetical protein WA005_02055 [Candidatus Binataceae bacterium]